MRDDLSKAYHSDEGLLPPSRVDEAVFAAASAHFARPGVQTEAKPGVLSWIGRRPLRSAGLGGALLAASVLVVMLIGSPNPQTPSDRSIAMETVPQAAEAPGDASPTIDSADEVRALPPAPVSAARSGRDFMQLDRAREAESAELLLDSAPLARRESLAPPSPVRGDVNGDGIVTIADALLLARLVDQAGGALDAPRYDLLGDGTVSRADADAIARLVVRLAAPTEDTNTEGAS
jgi:hypothetical protein